MYNDVHPSSCSLSSKANVARNFSRTSGSAAFLVSKMLKPKSGELESPVREGDEPLETISETPSCLVVAVDESADGELSIRREVRNHVGTPHEAELAKLSREAMGTSSDGGEGGGG